VFGENKVQELVQKQPLLPEAQWHLIGHLQTNKVKQVLPHVQLIHSLDSERLIAAIDKHARTWGKVVAGLLQINISDEANKSGLTEAEAKELLGKMGNYPFVKIEGLMGMAEETDNPEVIRKQFERLALALHDFQSIRQKNVRLTDLSMGMSGDYPIAVECGATWVRIGSAIFGSRK
jgi:pyridoxal phosphate enzyme (YggS family)